MNDFRDLKAIAEACQRHQPLRFMRSHGALYIRNDNGIVFDVHQNRSFPEFMAQNKDYADLALAANPETILALIAENRELGRYLCTCRDCGGEGALHTGDWHSYGHMEPPEPVMEKCGECDGTGLLGEIQDLYQVITERDQLRAEVAGLKTGYEAYERVNAELKAEVEGLRKDVDRAAYWKQRAKSAEGHLFSGDFRAAAMELHKYSRFESTPWPELTGSQHALISSAAGAVIATVNRLRDARRPKNRDETDAIIWCACGDGYAVNSYGAGFMDANEGVCANCDAALGQGEQS